MTDARVYVGTYAKYNDGNLAGAWIDLDGHDKDSFYKACKALHKTEHDPELMFQDYEGFPSEFYGESGMADGLWDWLEMDETEQELLARYIDATGKNDATLSDAQDSYAGTYESGADFAEQYAESCGDVPESFPTWIQIDWEASWNCTMRHDYSTSRGNDGLYFFCDN